MKFFSAKNENLQPAHKYCRGNIMMEEYCGEPQYAYIQYSANPQEGLQLMRFGKEPCQEKRGTRLTVSTLTVTTHHEDQQTSETADTTHHEDQQTSETAATTHHENQQTSETTATSHQEAHPTSSPMRYHLYNQQHMLCNQQPMRYDQQPMRYNQQPMQYNICNQQPMQYNICNQQPMLNNQQPMLNNQQPMHYNQQPMRLLNVVEPSSHFHTQSQSDYLFTQLQKQQHKCHYFQELSLKQEREIQSLEDKLQLSDKNLQQLRGVLVGRIKYAESLKK